jgi:hypothetical protein
MRISRVVVHLVLVAVGVVASVGSAVEKRRAAVVPHMVPTPRSGQNIYDGRGQVYIENSIVTRAQNPQEAPEANAGLYIPRYQMGGGLRLRMGENWDLGFLFEYGFREGAIAVAQDVPPGPDHGAVGAGISVGYSIRATQRFRIGIVLDTLLYAIPYVEYLASNCPTPSECTGGEKRSAWIPVASLSVLPSLRVTRWLAVFTGITLRNHPTIDKHSWETIGDDNDVEVGPVNVTLGLGAEFQVHQRVRLMIHAYWPVTRDPVIYYPVLGAQLAVSFGRPVRAVRPQQPIDPCDPRAMGGAPPGSAPACAPQPIPITPIPGQPLPVTPPPTAPPATSTSSARWARGGRSIPGPG